MTSEQIPIYAGISAASRHRALLLLKFRRRRTHRSPCLRGFGMPLNTLPYSKVKYRSTFHKLVLDILRQPFGRVAPATPCTSSTFLHSSHKIQWDSTPELFHCNTLHMLSLFHAFLAFTLILSPSLTAGTPVRLMALCVAVDTTNLHRTA